MEIYYGTTGHGFVLYGQLVLYIMNNNTEFEKVFVITYTFVKMLYPR